MYSLGPPLSSWVDPESPLDRDLPRDFPPSQTDLDALIAALPALGPLLCLYPAVEAHPLAALERARGCRTAVTLDSDGPSESLQFLDRQGRCCLQLCLLPDSDYLQWDRLSGQVALAGGQRRTARLDTKGRGAVVRATGQPLWRACPLRLHAIAGGQGMRLAAACAALSPAGRRCAERLVLRARADAAAATGQASASSR